MTGEALGRIIGLLIFPLLVMAVVGGVYYLAVRPRLTFRQAMFRWWVVAIAVLLWVMGLCGQLVQSV